MRAIENVLYALSDAIDHLEDATNFAEVFAGECDHQNEPARKLVADLEAALAVVKAVEVDKDLLDALEGWRDSTLP